MAITTSCCLNLSSPTTPTSNPTSLPSKPTRLLACQKNGKWRKQCAVSMAWVIIGLQMGDFEVGDAIAKDMNMSLTTTVSNSRELAQVPRWSDKRMCPPWNLNSLETIVPENLPRPSARRRLETVRYSSKIAPVLVQISNSNCFTM